MGELNLSRLANRDATEFFVWHQLPFFAYLDEDAAFDCAYKSPTRASCRATDRLVKQR